VKPSEAHRQRLWLRPCTGSESPPRSWARGARVCGGGGRPLLGSPVPPRCHLERTLPARGSLWMLSLLKLRSHFCFYRLFRELTLALRLLPPPQQTFPCSPRMEDLQVPGPQSAHLSCPAPPLRSGRWGGHAERSWGDKHTPSVGWTGSPISLSDYGLPVSPQPRV